MILIFDIGKTNKKCFIFDEDYRIVFEKTTQLAETTDEEGEPCEDLVLLKNWILDSFHEVLNDTRFQIRAVNVATYGASFVHIPRNAAPGYPNLRSEVLTPLCNYLKPFPEDLLKQFFDTYGAESGIALETASPVLGNLNSGLQLYWLKYRKPQVFEQIEWSLHLPQYVAYLIQSEEEQGRQPVVERQPVMERQLKQPVLERQLKQPVLASEITSIGCHTMLWDFRKNDYHDWVKQEGITARFPPIRASNRSTQINKSTNQQILHIGGGLHDSSAALIPYLACFKEPFLLISTGTWCISLNPFNHEPLTAEELAQDCLCYLTYEGAPVKAARYFGGNEHALQVKALASEFGVGEDFYQNQLPENAALSGRYTQFMRQLVEKQAVSTRLALGHSPVRRIFVDGGFSRNNLYMAFLADAFRDMEIFAAEVAQATALGAALAIHASWNDKPIPQNLISLKRCSVKSQ